MKTDTVVFEKLNSLTRLESNKPAVLGQIDYQAGVLKQNIGTPSNRGSRLTLAKDLAAAYTGRLDSSQAKTTLDKLLAWFKDLVTITYQESKAATRLGFCKNSLGPIQDTLANLHHFLTQVRSFLPWLGASRKNFDEKFKHAYASVHYSDGADIVYRAVPLDQAFSSVMRTSRYSSEALTNLREPNGSTVLPGSSLALWQGAIDQFGGIVDLIGSRPSNQIEAEQRDRLCLDIMAQLAAPNGSKDVKRGFDNLMNKICQLTATCYGPAIKQNQFVDYRQRAQLISPTREFFANVNDFMVRLRKVWRVKDSGAVAQLDKFLNRKQSYPIIRQMLGLTFQEMTHGRAIKRLMKLY